jgi:hypothetical protein
VRRTSLTTSTRSTPVDLPADEVWERLVSAGARHRWYADAAPFVLRGAIDRLLGGAGRRWPVPERRLLERGDRTGFWAVSTCDHTRLRLVLEAQVRAPGTVLLESRVTEEPDGSRLLQSVTFEPRGLVGAAYLLADLPAREAVIELAHRAALAEVRAGS